MLIKVNTTETKKQKEHLFMNSSPCRLFFVAQLSAQPCPRSFIFFLPDDYDAQPQFSHTYSCVSPLSRSFYLLFSSLFLLVCLAVSHQATETFEGTISCGCDLCHVFSVTGPSGAVMSQIQPC